MLLPTTAQDVWQRVLTALQLQMTRATFDAWLKHTRALELDGDTLVVAVPNSATHDWLTSRLGGAMRDTVATVAGPDVAWRFVVDSVDSLGAAGAGPVREPQPSANHFEQPTLPASTGSAFRTTSTILNPRYRFDTFVVGAGNRLAHAAAQAVAEHPAQRFNPLFIYGGVGLGKTHLLHAIAHSAASRGLNVQLVSSEKFTNDLINAIRTQATDAFRAAYRACHMLLIDDVHFIAGKESTQEEFFHTFNAIHEADGQIVLSSDRPPQHIATLEDRLRSRFQWGLQVDIAPPDLETRIAILRAKNERLGHEVNDAVLEQIAAAVQNNVRELEGALNRVIAYAQSNGFPLNADTASRALADLMIRREPPALPEIIRAVAAHYDVSEDELRGRGRTARVAEPRQVAMYLMREEADASFPAIGAALGGRDHTTAMHGAEKITRMVEVDAQLQRDLVQLRQRLYSR
ncbi:MAG: chromosomal replication initiator protein DnaA [Ardenticatenales bacterium]|jgi:chromosomal replication initiator protein|nr:chromosomal replication initiator protein DnaA [Ardenticatenales bacterium]